MTIYEIKQATMETSPYFFSTQTLKFFNQTLKSFTVRKQADGRYRIGAAMRDRDNRYMGETVRLYNPVTHKLEAEVK